MSPDQNQNHALASDVDTMDRVCERLRRAGITATVEYPGFISVRVEDNRTLNFGTANDDVWGCDYTTDDGENLPTPELFAVVPADSTDFNQIAYLIACAVTVARMRLTEQG